MNRRNQFANLTHFDQHTSAPELQLAVQQFTQGKAPQRALDLFNTAHYERWADALRAADMCAQQHRDSQLNMTAMQRAPANKSH